MHYGPEVFSLPVSLRIIWCACLSQRTILQFVVPEKASWSIIASSFFNNDWNWGAEKAIDGIELPENAFVSAGAAPALQWLQIDFGITVKVLTGTPIMSLKCTKSAPALFDNILGLCMLA